jgi:hypothetical protein
LDSRIRERMNIKIAMKLKARQTIYTTVALFMKRSPR